MNTGRWNPNIHYYPSVLGFVPANCREALDVGCGDGTLARLLAARAWRVTGIDLSAEMIESAREQSEEVENARFMEADFFEASGGELPLGHYDLITMVAVAHHLGTERALARSAELLAPGGRLVVIGIAGPGSVVDLLHLAAAVPSVKLLSRRRGGSSAPEKMPVADPDTTFAEARKTAHRVLPDSRFRRRLLWRYTLLWEKPRDAGR
ncbi:class I SAM-dependent methyltransferase [Streptomyces spinosus]|uniref:class I SAM-dependent methyltransferase n=1 Tax=Streptomyces spinosus TaxID=2872623 RepID=UPI001CEC1545|nr:class I SAM-dependent methyltransferase [Streptomyces spinosus]